MDGLAASEADFTEQRGSLDRTIVSIVLFFFHSVFFSEDDKHLRDSSACASVLLVRSTPDCIS